MASIDNVSPFLHWTPLEIRQEILRFALIHNKPIRPWLIVTRDNSLPRYCHAIHPPMPYGPSKKDEDKDSDGFCPTILVNLSLTCHQLYSEAAGIGFYKHNEFQFESVRFAATYLSGIVPSRMDDIETISLTSIKSPFRCFGYNVTKGDIMILGSCKGLRKLTLNLDHCGRFWVTIDGRLVLSPLPHPDRNFSSLHVKSIEITYNKEVDTTRLNNKIRESRGLVSNFYLFRNTPLDMLKKLILTCIEGRIHLPLSSPEENRSSG